MVQSRSKTKDYNLVGGSETGLCACVFLHSNPFTLEILCSDALGDCSRSFALKKAVLTANTLQISELFSHLQCALKGVILQVKLRYTNCIVATRSTHLTTFY